MDGLLKKEIRRLGISDDDVDRCRTAFELADVDKTGWVDAEELGNLLASVTEGIPQDEILEIQKKHASAEGAQLDFSHFLQAFCSTSAYQSLNWDNMVKSAVREAQKCADTVTDEYKVRVLFSGVSAKYVYQHIKQELLEMRACMLLPLVIIHFLMFALAVHAHERIDVVYGQRQAIIFDIESNANFGFSEATPFENGRMGHKGLYDVNSFADFWSWMNLGLVPLVWNSGWSVNEVRANILQRCSSPQEHLKNAGMQGEQGVFNFAREPWLNESCANLKAEEQHRQFGQLWYGEPATPSYMWFNSIIGGLRLQQERVTLQSCASSGDYVQSVHRGPCVGSYGNWHEPEPDDVFRRRTALMNRTGGETLVLLSGEPQATILQQTSKLEKRVWLSPLTSKVELLLVTYNPHLDLITFTTITFFPNSAGHINKNIMPTCIWLNPYKDGKGVVFDAIWCLCLLHIMWEKITEFKHQWKSSDNMLTAARDVLKFGNLMDWINIAAGFAIMMLWALHLNDLESLKQIMSVARVDIPGSFKDESTLRTFHEVVDYMTLTRWWYHWILAVYPFVLVTRFFHVCAGQPRLALMTKTLQRAATDVFHFGVVFAFVYMVFVLSAMITFGPSLSDFSTFSRALDTSFHVLLGDFEWDEMHRVGMISASLWFWAFIWLLNLLMFNMLLAIIMDVYMETRGSLPPDAETLWSQALEIIDRWRRTRRGERMTLEDIKQHLDCSLPPKITKRCSGIQDFQGADEMSINVKTLKGLVPGLPQNQAERILTEAYRLLAVDESSQTPSSISDAMVSISRMERRLVTNTELVKTLLHIYGSKQLCNYSDGGSASSVPSPVVEMKHDARKQLTSSTSVKGSVGNQEPKILERLDHVESLLIEVLRAIGGRPVSSV